MLISIYILITWIRQANRKHWINRKEIIPSNDFSEQIKRLTGYTAKPEFLQQITWIAFHHSPLISKIDTVRAFHFGTHFLVEVCSWRREDSNCLFYCFSLGRHCPAGRYVLKKSA